MFRTAGWISALFLFSFVAVGWSQPERKGKVQSNRVSTAQEIRNRLAARVTVEKVEANTPLREVLELLSDRYDLPVILDNSAFKADRGVDSADELYVGLPRMAGMKLSTVFRLLVSQVNGAYLVRGDHIEITTAQRAAPLAWQKGREFAPTVDADFQNQPLNAALQELADQSGVSIVLDVRSAELAKTPVTATLNGVPVATAVDLLADMVGLKMVVKDRVLYVTSAPMGA
jgi:hypothetical protein